MLSSTCTCFEPILLHLHHIPSSGGEKEHRLSSSTEREKLTSPSYDDYNSVWTATPAWLAQRSWQNPSDARDTPSATTWNTPNTTLFEYLSQNPVQGARFGCMMAMQAGGKTMWADEGAYPVRERLGNASDDEVLVVDIGGGAGHDLLGFRARYPDLKGKLVLQEMPYMVEKIKREGACEGVVELMDHDFYGEQPVKGSFQAPIPSLTLSARNETKTKRTPADTQIPAAHSYFFHQILHDYSDATCRQILQQIIPAMKAGTSKILINELVLPDQGAHWLTTSLDIALMTCLAARERTEREFRELFESVGLVVQGIWKHPQGFDSVIEVTLAEG
jgi:hypothetical protein